MPSPSLAIEKLNALASAPRSCSWQEGGVGCRASQETNIAIEHAQSMEVLKGKHWETSSLFLIGGFMETVAHL